jgi:hypothetical protein
MEKEVKIDGAIKQKKIQKMKNNLMDLQLLNPQNSFFN